MGPNSNFQFEGALRTSKAGEPVVAAVARCIGGECLASEGARHGVDYPCEIGKRLSGRRGRKTAGADCIHKSLLRVRLVLDCPLVTPQPVFIACPADRLQFTAGVSQRLGAEVHFDAARHAVDIHLGLALRPCRRIVPREFARR